MNLQNMFDTFQTSDPTNSGFVWIARGKKIVGYEGDKKIFESGFTQRRAKTEIEAIRLLSEEIHGR